MTYNELKEFYRQRFSLGYLNPTEKDGHSPFERKLILISLICFVYDKNKLKNPDLTYYELIRKLCKKTNLFLPEDFIIGLSIVCEDFGYESNSFPTFGLEGKNILKEITDILGSYLPF